MKNVCHFHFIFCPLQKFPIKDVLGGGMLLEEYRPDLINMILEKLTPDAIRYDILSDQESGPGSPGPGTLNFVNRDHKVMIYTLSMSLALC